MLPLNPRLFLSFFLIFFTLTACTKQLRPTTSPPQKLDASLEELLDHYQERSVGPSGLKALLQVKAELGPRGTHSFQAAWRAQNSRTKISGFDLFGRTLFDLKLSTSHFSLHVPSEQRVLEGELDTFEASAGEVIPLASRDLIAWVNRGGNPDLSVPRITALEKGSDIFILYVFLNEGGKGRLLEKIWIERMAFRVEKVALYNRFGQQHGVLEFKDYRQVEGKAFPFFVKGSGRGETIDLIFREVSFPAATEATQ